MAVVLLHAFLLAGGIAALTAGAFGLVQGGSALAKRIGISPLWIGLTIVALGTSMPELVVTVLAAVRGAGGVAVGNIVGSNIMNMLVVLGLTAFTVSVAVARVTQRRDIGVLVAVSVGMWALMADGRLHWAEGLFLLVAVVPYMVHLYRAEKRGWIPVPEAPRGLEKRPVGIQVLAAVVGIVLLGLGGDLVVRGGTAIAQELGVSDRILGLTIVAAGTSAPELAASLVALAKRKPDMAVGNIVGSNILNSLLVLGAAASFGTLDIERTFIVLDVPLMVGATAILWYFARTGSRISRLEGTALLLLYLAYIAYVIGTAA